LGNDVLDITLGEATRFKKLSEVGLNQLGDGLFFFFSGYNEGKDVANL
jgi:hypothetical protein